VIIANNPNGHVIEVSTRERWANPNANNVVIQNMTMLHAATRAFGSALSSDTRAGFALVPRRRVPALAAALGVSVDELREQTPVCMAINVQIGT
jgi:hypothetical protein